MITMNDLSIRLPDILFKELDGAAFNQACEFCSSFAWNRKRERKKNFNEQLIIDINDISIISNWVH